MTGVSPNDELLEWANLYGTDEGRAIASIQLRILDVTGVKELTSQWSEVVRAALSVAAGSATMPIDDGTPHLTEEQFCALAGKMYRIAVAFKERTEEITAVLDALRAKQK